MILAALCFVWAGMVLGISFLETPVKFTAPSVTRPIGLDVGRHVFRAFNKVEIGWMLLAGALLLADPTARAVWLPVVGAMTVVVLQTAWLLPLLDARVGLILLGQTPPRAPYHVVYIALELVKVASLFTAGGMLLRH